MCFSTTFSISKIHRHYANSEFNNPSMLLLKFVCDVKQPASLRITLFSTTHLKNIFFHQLDQNPTFLSFLLTGITCSL